MIPDGLNNADQLKNWWKRTIDIYRTRIHTFRTEEQQYLFDVGKDYSSPTQLDIIWLRDPEFQIITTSHSKIQRDKIVTVYGPAASGKFTQIVEEFLGASKWDMPLDEDYKERSRKLGITSVRDLISFNFSLMGRSVRNSVFTEIAKPSFSMGMPLADHIFSWLVKGNMLEITPEKYMDDINSEIDRVFLHFNSHHSQAVSTSNNEVLPSVFDKNRLSCFFFPPVMVGRLPRATNFKEYFTKEYRTRGMEEVVLSGKFNESKVHVTRDGEIMIETGDRSYAKKLFNLIFAISTYYGVECQAVQEDELDEWKLKEDGKYVHNSFGIRFSKRSSLSSLRYPEYNAMLYPRRKQLSREMLEDIISKAEIIFSQDFASSNLTFWLEAKTHLSRNELPQAYLMAWIVIEKSVWKAWYDFLDQSDIRGKLSNKLRNPRATSFDRQIDYLAVTNIIDKHEYETLDKLRKVRNDFIHQGKTVLKEDVEKCLSVSESYIKEYLLDQFNKSSET